MRRKKSVQRVLTIAGIVMWLMTMGIGPAAGAELAGVCASTNTTRLHVPDDDCATNVKGYIGLHCPEAANAVITGVTLEVRVFHEAYDEIRFQLLHTEGNKWVYFDMFPDAGQGWNTHTWQFSDFNGLPVNALWRLMAWDCYEDNAGFIEDWSLTVTYSTSPAVVGGQPASGASCPGQVQVFETVVEDPDGVDDLDSVQYMFNQGAWMQDMVHLKYRANVNLLYLYDEDTSTWLGGYGPGSNEIIENQYARLHVAQSSTERVGDRLTVNWAIEFLGPFVQPSPYNQLLYVLDRSQFSDGWEGIGDWLVEPCPATPTATATTTPTPRSTPTPTGTATRPPTGTSTPTMTTTLTPTVVPPTATWTPDPYPYPGPFTPSDYIYLPLIMKNHVHV